MEQIIIGRLGTQPFSIKDDTVSREHARLYFDRANHMMIIENISKNSNTFIRQKGGAFVQVMSRCNIDPSTEIRLGPRYIVRASQLINEVKTPPPPPTKKVDIAFLRRVAEHYEAEKLRLDQKNVRYNNLRSLFMVIGLLGTFAGATATVVLGKDDPVPGIIITGAILAIAIILWLYIDNASKSVIPEKNKNEKDYKIKYCCPICHSSLAGRLYENILASGKCPNCKTEFYDSQI